YLEENLAVGSLSAKVAIGIAVILSILAGVLVW
ncbi:succinate dehydrogenase cytochrome b556 large subunit, partial [Enterobacter hormaechei]|nr:succinate dehydrogenase cytochrome b556 large subunit [Enterobacter hormaechei]